MFRITKGLTVANVTRLLITSFSEPLRLNFKALSKTSKVEVMNELGEKVEYGAHLSGTEVVCITNYRGDILFGPMPFVNDRSRVRVLLHFFARSKIYNHLVVPKSGDPHFNADRLFDILCVYYSRRENKVRQVNHY